jgi:phytanoyl-CoA dioxygenase PhyH
MNAGPPPSPPFRPLSRGYALDPTEFGEFADSSHLLGDVTRLRQRILDDGYLYLPGFFKRADVLAARQVVTDRLMAQGFLDPDHPSIDGVVADVTIVNSKSAFRPPTGHNPEQIKAYNADDLTRQNRPLLDLLHQGKLIDFFAGYFGGPVLHYNYIWFRAVGPGMGTPPHCDMVYMGRGTPNLMTTWVPLGDTPLNVGGLMILENSHQQAGRLQHYLSRDVDEYCSNSPNAEKIKSGELLHEWDGVLSKNPASLREKLGGRWLTAEYHAGDVLIFTMRTVHASLDNQSNQVRLSVDTRYQLQSEPADERFMVENPVPYSVDFKKGRVC